MKKLFSLIFALTLSLGSMWAYNIGGNSTPIKANLIQQGTSSTFEVRVLATNTFTEENALIARIISPMTSTTSIAGNHSFDCGASNTYYIVNQFTSTGGAYYVEYSSSAELVYNYKTYYVEVKLAGDIQFTWLSTDADGVPTYRIQMSDIEGCFSGSYAYPFANTDPWDIPVYAFKSDGTTPIRLTDYFLVTGAADNASYGSVSGGGYYAAGATPTITANPNPGYRFVRWTDGNTQQSRTLSSLSADVTYTAEFEVVPRGTITGVASPAEGGEVTVSPTGEQAAGTPVTLTPNANPSYVFTGWADGGNDNPRTVYVAGDREYTANFALLRTINVAADPVAYGSVTGGGSYADGATATLTATGLNGYIFSQWSDGNTSNPRSFTVSESTAAVTYTAQFTLQTMSIATCSDASISFHCGYSDCTTHSTRSYLWKNGSNSYCNELVMVAKNSNNRGFQLIFTRNSDTNYGLYTGGECNNINGPYPGTYNLNLAVYSKKSQKSGWRCPTGNNVICYATSGSNPCSDYSYILNGTGNTINIKNGSITVRENNVGGIFIETSGVSNYSNSSQSIYFTFGNRSEQTVDLGTGTMSMTPSGLTMSASNGNHSASIKLNNSTTGNKTLADFDVNNSCFVYNGTPFSEISNITGTLSSSIVGGVITYTLTLKIRDCQQNLYNVTMSATAPSFALGWGANGGVLTGGTAAGSVQFGATITAPTGSLAGSDLTGWSPDFTGTMPANDVTYTAQWTQKTYTLSATTNPTGLGSVTFSKSAPYHYNDAVTLTAPEVTGYTFSGWGGTNSSMMSDDVFTFSADDPNNTPYAVTANYKANEYTITLNNQSATTGGTSSQTVDYRTALPDITVPTKTGNAFGGYFTETNGGGTMLIGTDGKWVKSVSGYTDASGNLIHADGFTLYAKWTELVTFTIADYSNGTVTVTPNDGSGAFTTGSRDLAVGTMVTLNFAAAEHYHISYVTLKGNQFTNGMAYTLKTGDGTVTLTADFLPDTYAITYLAGENGTGTIDAGEKTYNEDFTLSSSTFTRTGYTQTGWSTTDGGNKAYDLGDTYTGNTALALYPYWKVNSYSLTWTTDGDALTGTYTSGTVEYGTTIVQPNTPTKASTVQYAYTFNGWDPTPAETMPAATTEYTATWTQTVRQYALTVEAGENGTVTGGGTYDYGTNHDIEATADDDYHFVEWQDGNTDNPRTITIDETTPDVTYTATFALNVTYYTLSISAGANGSVNTAVNGQKEAGTEVEIEATPNTFYEFVEWSDGNTDNPRTVTMNSNVTLTAQFALPTTIELNDNEDATYYAAFDALAGNENRNVTLLRTLKGNTWNTINLPFVVDFEEPGNEAYDDKMFYEFKGASGDYTGLMLYFVPVGRIEANVPYLVRPAAQLVNPTFYNVTLQAKPNW